MALPMAAGVRNTTASLNEEDEEATLGVWNLPIGGGMDESGVDGVVTSLQEDSDKIFAMGFFPSRGVSGVRGTGEPCLQSPKAEERKKSLMSSPQIYSQRT